MNLEKYLVVSGIPGVHKLVTTRSNGLLIDDRNEGRVRFITIRQNPVTPLGTIGIYIDTDDGQDTVSLGEVFQIMLDQSNTYPVVSPGATGAELRAYFTQVLPNHDQDRVHINDIKKCIKWFAFMLEKGMFEEIKNDANTEEVENVGTESTEDAVTTDIQEPAAEPADAPASTTEANPDETAA